jgi:Ca2+-dependent lipid-binding protein
MSALKMLDTESEGCEWLNTILTKYWSQYEPGLSEGIALSINSVLELNKPTFLVLLLLLKFIKRMICDFPTSR